MWIGKIGNKSAAFINHKEFHPGNFENLERVWIAEENYRKELKRQKEMLEKREEEKKLRQITDDLRQQEQRQLLREIRRREQEIDEEHSDYIKVLEERSFTSGEINDRQKNRKSQNRVWAKSKYKENIMPNNHTSVFGSFYDKDTGLWGYKCCKSHEKNVACSNAVDKNKTNKRKKRKKDSSKTQGLAHALSTINNTQYTTSTQN